MLPRFYFWNLDPILQLLRLLMVSLDSDGLTKIGKETGGIIISAGTKTNI